MTLIIEELLQTPEKIPYAKLCVGGYAWKCPHCFSRIKEPKKVEKCLFCGELYRSRIDR